MTSTEHAGFASNWKDIASAFLRLGATSYRGPAILGIMQPELQEKRQSVSRERFVVGLSLVNVLPGAAATPRSGARSGAGLSSCAVGARGSSSCIPEGRE